MKLKPNEQFKYRCDKCGKIKRHIDMYDEKMCYECHGDSI